MPAKLSTKEIWHKTTQQQKRVRKKKRYRWMVITKIKHLSLETKKKRQKKTKIIQLKIDKSHIFLFWNEVGLFEIIIFDN